MSIARITEKMEFATSDISNAVGVIPHPHATIHANKHYFVQGFATLDTAGTLFIKIVTPNTNKWSHFIFNITSSGITSTFFDEAATGGMTGGSLVVPRNNNRNALETSGMVITSGVTDATSYTTRLENLKWGAQGFKSVAGGSSSREDELILKQNTTYLRTFTSFTDANIIQYKAIWYEHTNI